MSISIVDNNSLHGKVREQLRTQYLEPVGRALPSLRELSRQLGVNHSTVSRALRDLEKEGVVEVVPRKGVFSIAIPATQIDNPAIATGDTIELVVIASEHQSVLDVASPLTRGMQHALQVRDAASSELPAKLKFARSILNVPSFPDPDAFVADLRCRCVGGVAFLGFDYLDFPDSHYESNFLFEVSKRIPTVLIGAPHSSLQLDCVFSDPRPQLQNFLEEAYAAGLRRFEYLGTQGHLSHQKIRREAFCSFIMNHGLTWPGNAYGPLTTPELAARLKALDELPEVVVATNVNRALTFVLEAQRRGLQLPDDIRVLCFASNPEQTAPILPYATIALLDEAAVGESATRLLLERWNQTPAHDSRTGWHLLPAQMFKP